MNGSSTDEKNDGIEVFENCSNRRLKPPVESRIISIDELELMDPSNHQLPELETDQSGSGSEFLLLDPPPDVRYPLAQYPTSEAEQMRSIDDCLINHDHFSYPKPSARPLSFWPCLVQLVCTGLVAKFFFNSWFFLNFLTVDSVISGLIFLINYYGLPMDWCLYQESTGKRYCYYLLISLCYYNVTGLLWFDYRQHSLPWRQISLVLLSTPMVISRIANLPWFLRFYHFLRNEVYFLVKYLASKKVAGLINKIGIQYLNNHPQVKTEELIDLIDKISFQHLVSFLGSCLFASLLFYLELDGVKFYTIIFRQYYFRQYFLGSEQGQLSDRSYVIKMINERQWGKLLDPYALNRLMKFYLELNEVTNGGLLSKGPGITHSLKESSQRFMVNWTVYSLIGLPSSGIWTYGILIWRDRTEFLTVKLVVLMLYIVLSLVSNEQVLFLLVLEINLLLVSNHGFMGLLKDLKKITVSEFRRHTTFKKPTLSKIFYLANFGYWLLYWIAFKFFYHWEAIAILILAWISFRLHHFYYSWSAILLMVLANLWSTVSGSHPLHLFLLNSNVDFLRILCLS
jgi:hypothetical protein